MKRSSHPVAAVVLLALLVIGVALVIAAESESVPQRTCPPCRQPLDGYGKELHVTHELRRVYVCCAGCATKMQRQWRGYLEIMAELGEVPDVKRDAPYPDEPVIHNPEGRGICEPCMGGACEVPSRKPKRR
jgi:hypothetical protein